MPNLVRSPRWVAAILLLLCSAPGDSAAELGSDTIDKTVATLVASHGEGQADRIRQGVARAARRWWTEDGDADAFKEFCLEHYLATDEQRERAFLRLQEMTEQIDGHLHEVRRAITTPLDLDTGEVGPTDRLLSAIDLASHVDEDLFNSKVAFLALLNFSIHTLQERLDHGATWDRETWARSRMMDRFAQRVPAPVTAGITRSFTAADQYIADYNIRMDRLVAADGSRPFPEGLRLITHWGLRDELKSQYAEPDGLDRQRMILKVMERIVRQEIPQVAIDNEEVLWSPYSNEVRPAKKGGEVDGHREPDTRYERLLSVFRAVRKADRYNPKAPTYIDRRFDRGRQIPEKQVRELLVSVLRSKEFAGAGALIAKRLDRQLEPFDIWYNGFASGGGRPESELDEIVAARYPDVAAFQRDLPRILTDLGFAADRAAWLAERIVVDPSRGAGHAMGAVRREDQAHLRTRIGNGGMDYKGYNIAVHELGHNVEQVFSLNAIDHWWLNGVPNTAFTEALAFVFQNRDLELLGLSRAGAETEMMEALDTLWNTAEIGGVALVDMAVWRFMYEHPDSTPAELREAILGIAREVWNTYFASVVGRRDSEILAIYSHMIVYGLYLPDYPIGHIIAFQVDGQLREGDFGKEFERVSRQGRLTPDAWMRGAVGGPVSATALLSEARKALAHLAK